MAYQPQFLSFGQQACFLLSLKIKLQQIPCFHLLLQISIQTGKHMISTTQSQLNGYESQAMSLEFNCIKRCQKVFGHCLLKGILFSQALQSNKFSLGELVFLEFSKGYLILSNHCQVGNKFAQHLKFSSLLHKIISNIQNLETPTKLTEKVGKPGLSRYYNRNFEFSLCLTPKFCNLVKPLDLFFEYYY